MHSPVSKRRWLLWALGLALVGGSAAAIYVSRGPSRPPSSIAPRATAKVPRFVGSEACGRCHDAEFKSWQGSHHELAMQPATDTTVLGDFNNTRFTGGGVTSTFFRRDKKFVVRTDGPDGLMHDYQIGFTFGVFPLQQYLIAMPGGRLQAFGIAWDTRPREVGGQRWFHLYPKAKLGASDPLHWTAIDQTWNYMCADCHSTNVRKGYNQQARSYDTTYAEINVACEACHGPGSNHVAWAGKPNDQRKLDANEGLTILLDERRDTGWVIDPASNTPHRSKPRETERELQMCARCHARRSQIHQDYVHGQSVEDDYRVALLDSDIYFPDGQIKREDYEYGSFIQSRMFHEGVTCSDCHEPHTSKLRAEGNALCLSCHLTQKYDSPRHYFHKTGTKASQCIECHMPTRTYMVVDSRRDHSIRIPRPDSSITLGTPNACNQCHTDRSAQWASDALNRWYGKAPVGFQDFAEALNGGVQGAPGSLQTLDALILNESQPAIARATALTLLASFAPSPNGRPIDVASIDNSPLVRRASARALSFSDLKPNVQVPRSLLDDRVRGVRIEAAEAFAGRPSGELPSGLSAALDRATAEYVAAQELNADRPESHLNLALLFGKEGKLDRAEDELKTALSIDGGFAPAAVNLADLFRETGRDTDGEAVLRSALKRSPHDASLLHALGLLMIRQKKPDQALELLGEAAKSDPSSARYAYVYAVALHDSGRSKEAVDLLEGVLKAHRYDRDVLAALVEWWEQAGDHSKALYYRQRLSQLGDETRR